MNNGLFDCHAHTYRSHDSECLPRTLCEAAVQKGLAGLAVTNHCDLHICKTADVFSPLIASDRDVTSLRPEFADRLYLMSGVEIGEGILFPEETQKVYKLADWDVVLGSVHVIRYPKQFLPYSVMNLAEFTDEELSELMYCYFTDLEETVDTVDMDVLCHLTCPMRYIVGKFGRTLDLSVFSGQIETILRKVIDADIALEVNTSGLGTPFGLPMPDADILRRYRDMGGRKLTIGADTHTPQRAANGFDEVLPLLQSLGFDTLYRYEKRTAIPYSI